MNESELNQAISELKAEPEKLSLVYALADGLTVEEAIKKAKRSKGWFYGLPKDEQKRLTDLANELHAEPLIRAREILNSAIITAAEVKVSGLHSRNEHVKQGVATEILDRIVGKAANKTEFTGKDGGDVVIKVISGATFEEL